MTLMALHGALSPQITHSKRQENPIASLFPTLRTATPKEGDDPAIKLARVAVKLTHLDAEVCDRLRPEYAEDPGAFRNSGGHKWYASGEGRLTGIWE